MRGSDPYSIFRLRSIFFLVKVITSHHVWPLFVIWKEAISLALKSISEEFLDILITVLSDCVNCIINHTSEA